MEDRSAEVFVTLAVPIASGELSAPGDVDVAHARTLLGGDGCLVEFVAAVEAVLARHKAALDALVAIFQIGFISDADVDEAIEAVDRDLVGSITHIRALLVSPREGAPTARHPCGSKISLLACHRAMLGPCAPSP